MGKKNKEKRIGEVNYRVTQFGALKGRQILVRLFAFLGPAASGYLKGGLSEEGIAAALTGLSAAVTPEGFDVLCDEFASCTEVVEQSTVGPIATPLKAQFDDHFAGRYLEMVLWFAFAVHVNFADFLDVRGLGALLSGLPGVSPKSESKSPPA